MLCAAFTQSGNRASKRAIHLQAEEFIAVDTKGPGRVDLGYDTAVELKGSVSCVIRRALVAPSPFIDSLRDGLCRRDTALRALGQRCGPEHSASGRTCPR